MTPSCDICYAAVLSPVSLLRVCACEQQTRLRKSRAQQWASLGVPASVSSKSSVVRAAVSWNLADVMDVFLAWPTGLCWLVAGSSQACLCMSPWSCNCWRVLSMCYGDALGQAEKSEGETRNLPCLLWAGLGRCCLYLSN